MLLIQDIYSLIWGGTASVVGYGALDCGVCNYECVLWACEVSGYSQENPESLHVRCDYCDHTSNSHHPKAAIAACVYTSKNAFMLLFIRFLPLHQENTL